MASTVSVRCANQVGSGFFVRDDLVLTNAHVLCPRGEEIHVILQDHRDLRGQRGTSDESLDLGLIHTPPSGVAPLALGDAGALVVGDRVSIFGSPLGMEFTMTEVMVTKLSYPVLGVSYLQIDGRINPGNSGGPVVDRLGRVVAVVSLKLKKQEGTGLAIPINYAYGGSSPLVAPPAGGQSAGFADMVSRAQESEKKQIDEITAVEAKRFLVGVVADPQQGFVASVLQPWRHPPPPVELSFNVWRNGEKIYSFKASVRDWKPVPMDPSGGQPVDRALLERVSSWLDRNDANLTLYRGEATLPSSMTIFEEHGVQLELEGADPRAARAVYR
jgi:serine protease Do